MALVNTQNEVIDIPEINNTQEIVYLMAEDNPADAELVQEMLNQSFGHQYSIICVDRFSKIVDALSQGTFEALILDMNLPDSSGIENISRLAQDYPDLPIVVLTGHDDLELATGSLQQGAQDYLSKNHVTPQALIRSLRYAKERKVIEKQLKLALDDAANRNVQLEALAKHDGLTGLPNRTFFHQQAAQFINRAERQNKQVGLLYFDLNGFKKINDSYGHLIGDHLLVEISNRLQKVIREADFLARLGGDEFVVITDLLSNKEEVYPLIKRLLAEFDKPFIIENHQIISGPSIGVAFYPEAGDIDLLLKQADFAMHEAKKQSSTPICFYTHEMAEKYSRNQIIESRLGRAIEQKEISAFFQTVINVRNPNQILVEALVRWHSMELDWITPDEFIPLAEHTPAINDITYCVLAESSAFYQALSEKSVLLEKIAINVSASQLTNSVFTDLFFDWIKEYKLPINKICLELTERQMVQNAEQCRAQINRLRSRGIKVALDDFGSGYSSITHLLDFPMDILKLDRALIDHIDKNPRNQALVAGIVEMAHRLDMEVVAEGIEREEEYQKAVELGCDFLQGYFLARPMSADDAVSLLSDKEKE